MSLRDVVTNLCLVSLHSLFLIAFKFRNVNANLLVQLFVEMRQLKVQQIFSGVVAI